MAGDVLKDLESVVPQIRDLAGELNGVTRALGSVGSRAASAAKGMRDLYDPSTLGGGFEKLAADVQSFNQQLDKFGHSQTFKNFGKDLDKVKEGFKLMQQEGLKQMGILGKGFESTFKRMEATGKGFWRSFAKEIGYSIKGAISELLSFRNIFTVAMSVITASLNIVYKTINYFIDACKKGWEITVSWMNNLYAAAGSVAQSLGLSGQAVGKLRGQIESLYISESNLADNMGDIATAASAIMTAFRDQSPVTQLVDDIFLMGKAMGISTEGAAKLIFYFDRAWGVKGQKERRQFVSEQLEFANRIGVPHKEMLSTMEEQKDLISRLGKDGVVAIHRLTAASKAFGISQEKIVTNMAKFDTLEETIPTINKINILTGAAIDPFLVFAETDPAKKFTYMMENIRRSVGDWKNVDKWTKLALTNITGFTESEMEVAFSAGNMQKAVDDLMKKGLANKKTTEAWNDAVMAAKSFFVDFSRQFRPLFSQISKIFMGLAPSLVKALKNVLTGFSSLLKSIVGKDKGLNLLLYGKEEQGGGFASAVVGWSEQLKNILESGEFKDRAMNFVNNMRNAFLKAVEWINKLIEKIQKRLPGLMDQFNAFFNTVVNKVDDVLSKIEKYNVLGTVESVAKTLFKLIKFIDQNKGMLLGILVAFKGASAIGGFQQAYGSVYGLRNVAQGIAAQNVIGKGGFASEAAANNYIQGMGGDPNRFYKVRSGGTYEIEGLNQAYRPSAGERFYQSSQKRFGGTTRMGFGLGVGMTALVGAGQIAQMATQKDRVTGGQIGGAVGGMALGAIGAYLGGPVGAMIGSTIGNVAGKYIGEMLDTEQKMLNDQAKIQSGLRKSISESLEIRQNSEKKFAESLNNLSKEARASKEELFAFNDVANLLAASWTEERDASQTGLKLDAKGRDALEGQLQKLLGLGLITQKQFDGLTTEGGTIPMTKDEMQNMIDKIQVYNAIESERIGILEQSPEILAKRKEDEEEKARKKAKKNILDDIGGAPGLIGQEDSLTPMELKLHGKTRGEKLIDILSTGTPLKVLADQYSPEQKRRALGMKGIEYYEKKGIDIKDTDTPLFLESLSDRQKRDLLSGDMTEPLIRNFLKKGNFSEATDEGIINDLVNINLKMQTDQELAAAESAKNMEGLGEIVDVAKGVFTTTADNLSKFPPELSKEIISANAKNTEAFKKMIESQRASEVAKWTAVQNPLNKLMDDKDLMAVINNDPDLQKSFFAAMGDGQGGMISFFKNLLDSPKINKTLEQGKWIGDAISALQKPEREYQEWDAVDLGDAIGAPQFADGGPIKTNTVLSTITPSGRLRPYATAGEPGNPESVVPDRKNKQTINLNLTIPLSIDGKKITDVVIKQLIPLDA